MPGNLEAMEFGLRPIGAYAYAPAGKWKIKVKNIEQSIDSSESLA